MRHWTARATTTVPRPPHTSALDIAGERTDADAAFGERGAGEVALSGTARSLPGVAENSKIVKSQREYGPNVSVCCCTYCCTAVALGGWVVWFGGWTGWSAGEWVCGCFVRWKVGWSFRTWMSALVPVGGGPVLFLSFLVRHFVVLCYTGLLW